MQSFLLTRYQFWELATTRAPLFSNASLRLQVSRIVHTQFDSAIYAPLRLGERIQDRPRLLPMSTCVTAVSEEAVYREHIQQVNSVCGLSSTAHTYPRKQWPPLSRPDNQKPPQSFHTSKTTYQGRCGGHTGPRIRNALHTRYFLTLVAVFLTGSLRPGHSRRCAPSRAASPTSVWLYCTFTRVHFPLLFGQITAIFRQNGIRSFLRPPRKFYRERE